jgi:hypothetical protein
MTCICWNHTELKFYRCTTSKGLCRTHLSNATIGTKLEKKKRKKDKKKGDEEEEEEELIYGWAKFPSSDKQVLYAALDARLGFEIARRYWKLEGY